MIEIEILSIQGYEKVIEAKDRATGLHAFIAIHNTTLGPSLGGMRMHPYASREDALNDALRLSKAMTLKSALAETRLGGGKSVLIGDPKLHKSKELLHSFAEALNTLNGAYIAAEDLGITADDLLYVREISPHVAALPTSTSSGDPSRFTAFGIYSGIKAVLQSCFGSPEIKGKKFCIQGLGSVGAKLALFLFWEGAQLYLVDIDEERLHNLCHELGATPLKLDEWMTQEVDIFCPCALGGILNKESISKLNCRAIAGAANNQLQSEEDSVLLQQKGILFAPDFVINAGGIINASSEYMPGGYDPKWAQEKSANIFNTLIQIFQTAKKTGCSPEQIAVEIAENKLSQKTI